MNKIPKYRQALPQVDGGTFITDGGLETVLVFQQGITLPEFASFPLLENEAGVNRLRRYFLEYTDLAQHYGVGIILDSPTWRANQDWGKKLGYSEKALVDINKRAIELLSDIRDSIGNSATRAVISGCIGTRGDGYVPSSLMSVNDAAEYHRAQIETFAQTEADMVSICTINYVEEAIGGALAAKAAGMPVAISFTVETDGRMPSGDTLKQAIEKTDAATGSYPAYYMINCAHPVHFGQSLAPAGDWLSRIQGLRPNASKQSHQELNESPTLDEGDPVELASHLRRLRSELPRLTVVGGCCGTDIRHLEEICKAVTV